MKITYVIMVALMLAILSVGAVSADENVTGNNLLSNENVMEEDVLSESPDEKVIGQSDSDDIVAASKEANDNRISSKETDPIYIYDEVADSDGSLVRFDTSVNGTVKVMVNDKLKFQRSYDGDPDEILWEDLSNYKKLDYGNHNIKVIYTENGKAEPLVFEKKVLYTFGFDMYSSVKQKSQLYPSVKFINKVTFTVNVPSDAKNRITLKFNGKTYKLTPKKGEATLKLTLNNLKLGKHTVSAKLSYGNLPVRTIYHTFYIYPQIIYPHQMSVGENEFVHVIGPKNANGQVKMFDGSFVSDGDGGEYYVIDKLVKSVKLSKGYAKIPLNKLKKDSYSLSLNYTIGKFKGTLTCDDYEGIYIEVFANAKGFKAGVKPLKIKAGQKITVKLVGPKMKKNVKIYIDKKLYKSVSFKHGKIKEKIKGLKPGNHKVKVIFKKGNKFFSKTFYIDVGKKPKVSLKLKAVNVKKSAKKLTIKAKVKINGKPKKGRTVKFKFDKNTYKAKTNKWGIAKVSISKSILKKLDVGQKVEYAIKYAKKTKRLTAVVKE